MCLLHVFWFYGKHRTNALLRAKGAYSHALLSHLKVLIKSYTIISRRDVILDNIGVIRKIYNSSILPTDKNHNVAESCAIYSLKITRALFTLYLFCGSFLYPLPAIFYVLTGQLELMSPVLIPGTDPKELFGYFTLYLFHCHSVFFGSVCFAISDILFANSALHVLLFSGIMENKFRQMNEMLSNGELTMEMAKNDLKKMIVLHQDLLR